VNEHEAMIALDILEDALSQVENELARTTLEAVPA
jgi:hypothetical protein